MINKNYIYVFLKKVRRLLLIVRYEILRFISIIYLFRPLEKKVVFINYFGKGYGDNGKYITEKLLEKNKNIEIVWLVNKIDESMPKEIRQVLYKPMNVIKELSTASVWIDNCRKQYVPIKRKNQFYIQTWHSPLRLKMIEKDAMDSLSMYYIHIAKQDSKYCDLITSGSDFSTNLIEKSFWYEGKISEVGTPRCDIFINNNENTFSETKRELSLDDNSITVLYAPTFRKHNSLNFLEFPFEDVSKIIEKKFNKKCNILLRLHPNDSIKIKDKKFDKSSFFKNVTDYPDMQKLLLVSDFLITDFSSSMFDFLIAKKRCLIYAPDLQTYLSNERDMYFDLNEMPFPLSEKKEELVLSLKNFDDESYFEKLHNFSNKLGIQESGKASKDICNIICEELEKFYE